LISDVSTSIKLIDVLGGVGIQNQNMIGEQAISSITSWKENPKEAIYHQKLAIESICNQVAHNQQPNLKMVSELINRDFRSNTQTKIFLVGWTASVASEDNFSCNFPTLSQTSMNSKIVSR
jgi:hypothetical protein